MMVHIGIVVVSLNKEVGGSDQLDHFLHAFLIIYLAYNNLQLLGRYYHHRVRYDPNQGTNWDV